MEGKRKSSDNDGQPETKQPRSETTRTSDVSSGQYSVEMDTAEINETGDLSAGIISKGSQSVHASDSTESSSSESELEREKERLRAEEKRLTRSCRKQQLRAEINELKASVDDKKVKKQASVKHRFLTETVSTKESFTLGMDEKGKRSDKDKRPETEQARSDSLPEATRTSISNFIGMSGGRAQKCNINGQVNHTPSRIVDDVDTDENFYNMSKHSQTDRIICFLKVNPAHCCCRCRFCRLRHHYPSRIVDGMDTGIF